MPFDNFGCKCGKREIATLCGHAAPGGPSLQPFLSRDIGL